MNDRLQTTSTPAARPRRRGRSVSAIYGMISFVLVVGAVALALSTPPPSTPPLAAVAPAPQEQVEVERIEQDSRFGKGAGGEGDCAPSDPGCSGVGDQAPDETTDDGGLTTPDPSEAPIEVPSHGAFRTCAHGPGGARQTVDPQSPPCKREIFTGDNGGTTWPGVTATTIRIGYAVDPDSPTNQYGSNNGNQKLFPAWIRHFNRLYEFHGRALEFVEVEIDGRSDPSIQRADARAFAEAEVFAALSYKYLGPFQDELAEQGIVHMVDPYGAGFPTSAELTATGPYAWSIYPTLDQNLDAASALICTALVGRSAQHGGDDVVDQIRRFGTLVEQPGRLYYDDSILTTRLKACGADTRRYVSDGSEDPSASVRRMRDKGITTIVCVCDKLPPDYTEAAEAILYRPEWLLPGISDADLNIRDRYVPKPPTQPRAQIAHAFGLWSGPRRPPIDGAGRTYRTLDEYWFHAASAEDPEVREPTGANPYGWYAQLLALASGIQWAGPDLTPQTFADALTSLRFPNPDVGAAPWFQSSVGFGPTDRGFGSDYALFWWRDPDDMAFESGSDIGEVCFVGDGQRVTSGTIPGNADDLFFDLDAGCR